MQVKTLVTVELTLKRPTYLLNIASRALAPTFKVRPSKGPVAHRERLVLLVPKVRRVHRAPQVHKVLPDRPVTTVLGDPADHPVNLVSTVQTALMASRDHPARPVQWVHQVPWASLEPPEYRVLPVLRVPRVKKALLVLMVQWVNEAQLDHVVQLVPQVLEV